MRLETVLREVNTEIGTEPTWEAVRSRFEALQATSFDYRIVEQTDRICVVPFSGLWSDIGTWDALAGTLASSDAPNVIRDAQSVDSTVINELPVPLVVAGLSDCTVVATRDGILVGANPCMPDLKELLPNESIRPMVEEKRWGFYWVLDEQTAADGMHTLTKKLMIRSGSAISYQYHKTRDEYWTVLSGQAEVFLDGERSIIGPGACLSVMRGCRHSIRALSDLYLIEVQRGEVLREEDIVRLPDPEEPGA